MALVPVITASHVSGFSPLAVQFTCKLTTDDGKTQEQILTDLGYLWDFDDPLSGTFTLTTNNNSKASTDVGFSASHTFEVDSGTKVFRVGVAVKNTAGDEAYAYIDITVQSQETFFGGANTICYSTSGDFTGAPSGATLVTVTSNTDLPGWDGWGGKRNLWRRGDDFSAFATEGSADGFTMVFRHGQSNCVFDAFGPDTDPLPILRRVYVGNRTQAGTNANAGITDAEYLSWGYCENITFTNLRIRKILSGRGVHHVTAHKLDMDFSADATGDTGFDMSRGTEYSAVNPTPANSRWPKGIYVSECTIYGEVAPDALNFFMGTMITSFISIYGCYIRRAREHNIRSQSWENLCIHDNDILGEHMQAGGKHNIAARGQGYRWEIGEVADQTYENMSRETAITGISNTNPCVITFASNPFLDGEDVYISGSGVSQLDGNNYTTGNVTATTIELVGVDSSAFDAWVSGGTVLLNSSEQVSRPANSFALIADNFFSSGAEGTGSWNVQVSMDDGALTLQQYAFVRRNFFQKAGTVRPGNSEVSFAGRWLYNAENTTDGSDAYNSLDSSGAKDLNDIDLGSGTPSLVPIETTQLPPPPVPNAPPRGIKVQVQGHALDVSAEGFTEDIALNAGSGAPISALFFRSGVKLDGDPFGPKEYNNMNWSQGSAFVSSPPTTFKQNSWTFMVDPEVADSSTKARRAHTNNAVSIRTQRSAGPSERNINERYDFTDFKADAASIRMFEKAPAGTIDDCPAVGVFITDGITGQDIGKVQLGVGVGTVTIPLDFDADMILVGTVSRTVDPDVDDAASGQAYELAAWWSSGIAMRNTGQQRCMSLQEEHNQPGPVLSDIAFEIRNDAVVSQVTDLSSDWTASVTNWAAGSGNDIEITHTAGANGEWLLFHAIKFSDPAEVLLVDTTIPDSGDWSVTGLPGVPQTVINWSARNTSYNVPTKANTSLSRTIFDADKCYTDIIGTEFGVTITDVTSGASFQNNVTIRGKDKGIAPNWYTEAEFGQPSMSSGGWTATAVTNPSNNILGYSLIFLNGEVPPVPPPTTPDIWYQYNTGITSDGDGFLQWDDQTGGGRHMLRSTTAPVNFPQVLPDGTLSFDGVAHRARVNFTGNGFTGPCEWYHLVRLVSQPSADSIFRDGGTQENAQAIGFRANSDTSYQRNSGATGNDNTDYTLGEWAVLSCYFDGVNSWNRVNKGPRVSGVNIAARDINGIAMGATWTANQFTNVEFREFLFYNTSHPDATQDLIVDYLLSVLNPADPPILTAATGTATGPNSCSGTVTTDVDEGTLFYLVSENTSEPDAAVKAGSSQAVTSAGVQNVTESGLNASTLYYIHYLHEGPGGDSNNLPSSGFFTDAESPAVLSNPTGTATGANTCDGTVTTDTESGTLFYLVSQNASENATAIKAGSSQPVTASGVQNVSETGLTGATTYYIHYLQDNGNDSNIVRSDAFVTDAAPVLTDAGATPTGTTTADSTFTTTQTFGSIYFCITQDPGIPSPTQMRAGLDANNNPGEGNTGTAVLPGTQNTYLIPLTGLSAGTSYYVNFFQENSNGDSNVIRSPQFTTFFDIATLTNAESSAPNTTAFGQVTTDQGGGTLYHWVTQNISESDTDIIANGRTAAVTSAGVQNVQYPGLAETTAYYHHFVQVTVGNSNVASSAQFTTGLRPPASQLNDAILIATGGPTINDGLASWFGKTASESLNDAERRWLTEQGATPGPINDMWFEYTGDLGLTGALNDRLFDYWVAGGTVSGVGFFSMFGFGVCMESQGWTVVSIDANSITINGLASNVTLTRAELTGCGFDSLPAPVFNDVLTCVQNQGFCLATPFK